MEKIAFVICLFITITSSFSLARSIEPKRPIFSLKQLHTYYFFGGEMGFDSLSDKAIPNENSIDQANAIFNALDKAYSQSENSKTILFDFDSEDGDDPILKCRKGRNAQCELATLIHKNDFKQNSKNNSYRLRLPAYISKLIFNALTNSTEKKTNKYFRKKVANLTCAKNKKEQHKCIFKNIGTSTFVGIVPLSTVIPNLDTPEAIELQKELSSTLIKFGYTPAKTSSK